jgi:very-long-chain enoyl-CoA reductase
MTRTLVFGKRSQAVDLPNDARGRDLIDLARAFSRLSAERIRIVYESADKKRIPVGPDDVISSISAKEFIIRDLGPQFSYRGVFLAEYAGPLMIWVITFLVFPTTLTPCVGTLLFLWTFHYGKRLAESVLVHRFSHATMPLTNLFKNCTYYWGFAALIAFQVRTKGDSCQLERSVIGKAAVAAFFTFEALNFYCHVSLMNLRPSGSNKRFLPKGFLFNQIACPNYTMEICSWISFAVLFPNWSTVAFAIVGAAQMWVWAGEKKRRLVAEHPEARARGRLLPIRWL